MPETMKNLTIVFEMTYAIYVSIRIVRDLISAFRVAL